MDRGLGHTRQRRSSATRGNRCKQYREDRPLQFDDADTDTMLIFILAYVYMSVKSLDRGDECPRKRATRAQSTDPALSSGASSCCEKRGVVSARCVGLSYNRRHGMDSMLGNEDVQVAALKAQLEMTRLPRHIAIIMDGNGRWAERHGLPRVSGHRQAIGAIRKVVNLAHELGIPYLTLFAFSTENIERPAEEVSEIFRLFSETLEREVPELKDKGVRILVTGELEMLPEPLVAQFRQAIELTQGNERMVLNLCVMYSGRQEMARAARRIAEEVAAGHLKPQEVDERSLRGFFYQPELPDPDLLIRTSGERRLSNFCLWQLAYSEFVFTPTLWPDFDDADLLKALIEFQRRERRYGRVK